MDGKPTVSSSLDTDIHIQHANVVNLSIAQSCYLGFVWVFYLLLISCPFSPL